MDNTEHVSGKQCQNLITTDTSLKARRKLYSYSRGSEELGRKHNAFLSEQLEGQDCSCHQCVLPADTLSHGLALFFSLTPIGLFFLILTFWAKTAQLNWVQIPSLQDSTHYLLVLFAQSFTTLCKRLQKSIHSSKREKWFLSKGCVLQSL